MNIRNIGAGAISFLCVPILMFILLFSTIQYHAFDLGFYEHEYQKLKVPQEIGISKTELLSVTKELLAYIKADRTDLNINANINGVNRQVFNQREIEHMVDVQRLYLSGVSARNFGIFILLGFVLLVRKLSGKRFFAVLSKGYLIGVGVVLVALSVILYMIAKDFLWFWTIFHEVIFMNDLWLLNPETDILIQMVPEQFFLDLVMKVLVWTTLPLVILAGLSAGVYMPKRKQKWKNPLR